jgi:cellulose synthase/poly-beta-1,6-N-acetylglucosamine synthase-like glycosyltransferase
LSDSLIPLLIALVVSASIQLVLVAGFVARLRGCTSKEHARKYIAKSDEATASPALVVLCLRGGDPFLGQCIQGLVSQDYPEFEICFVVDSAQDPAISVLQNELTKYPDFKRFEIQMLSDPLTTCSLKCSSLIQAIGPRIDSQGFVAQLDADTIPHRTWLSELASALQDPEVGAATGNRWYMPETISLGNMTRYVWNGAAVVQMYWYGIAWGGTLAIKFDSIRRAHLLDRWRNALCEDTMLSRQLKSVGQKVAFVPSLMMVNRENCDLASFFKWVQRQLLTARLYHPLWFAVVVHGVSSALLLVWGWTTCVVYALMGYWGSALASLMAMLAFQTFLSLMLPWMDSSVRAIVNGRGEPADWHRNLRWWQLGWYVWTTQCIYTAALVRCLRMTRVEWRGIEYEVTGPFDIRMQGYHPFRSDVHGSGCQKHSL